MHQQISGTGSIHPGGTAIAVCKFRFGRGQVVMDHVFDLGYVQSTSGQIRCHQKPYAAIAELDQGLLPLHLFHASMKRSAFNAFLFQQGSRAFYRIAVVAENEGRLR